jgi:hypothetical protein
MMLHAVGPEATGLDEAARIRYGDQHNISGALELS